MPMAPRLRSFPAVEVRAGGLRAVVAASSLASWIGRYFLDANSRMPRTMALDYGERRIGVAVSDPTRTIGSPLTTLQRRAGKRPPWAEIAALVQEQEAD